MFCLNSGEKISFFSYFASYALESTVSSCSGVELALYLPEELNRTYTFEWTLLILVKVLGWSFILCCSCPPSSSSSVAVCACSQQEACAQPLAPGLSEVHPVTFIRQVEVIALRATTQRVDGVLQGWGSWCHHLLCPRLSGDFPSSFPFPLLGLCVICRNLPLLCRLVACGQRQSVNIFFTKYFWLQVFIYLN